MIKKMEHIAIIVKNMDESIQFYQQMFGFQVRARGSSATREMAFLYLQDHPSVEIELIRDLVPSDDYAEKGIVNHLAFTVEDIEQAMVYYQEKGIVFNSERPNEGFGGTKIIFFHGPNKELLQLVQPADHL